MYIVSKQTRKNHICAIISNESYDILKNYDEYYTFRDLDGYGNDVKMSGKEMVSNAKLIPDEDLEVLSKYDYLFNENCDLVDDLIREAKRKLND
ncbi:hypothetical protein POP12_115 [Pectobacterium phage POP12]|nr:hypothetical protein POP12_115 [Pectobacterium phage POP12]